ncbi:DUF3040 domain-containing protein [Streptomyces sp. INA 01156]
MPQSDDQRLVDLAARIEQDDPHFARSLSSGRPAKPREYRYTRAWWVLGIGVVLLFIGLVMPTGCSSRPVWSSAESAFSCSTPTRPGGAADTGTRLADTARTRLQTRFTAAVSSR